MKENMTFAEMLQAMRECLVPHNPSNPEYQIVKMGVHSNYGYMDKETVHKAIDCFEERAIACDALSEKLNPLESLGLILLLESAYLR